MPKIIITAGGTREKIDPVRYIGNYSSGKMGKALAQAFMDAGAAVKVISGAAEVHYPCEMVRVESAREMLAACEDAMADCDVFVACAAVADMRPKKYSSEKIKKQNLTNIELVENPDILATIAKSAQRPHLVIGFAAESENHVKNAHAKLTKKSCDLIILNDTSAMGEDENEVWVVSRETETKLVRASKDEIARQIVGYIQRHCEGV